MRHNSNAGPPCHSTLAPAEMPAPDSAELVRDRHVGYLLQLGEDPFSVETFYAEPMKMAAVFWALNSLHILNAADPLLVGGDSTAPVSGESRQLSSKDTDTSLRPKDSPASPQVPWRSRDTLLDWVFKCHDSASGGFAVNISYDPSLPATHYALSILAIMGALNDTRVNRAKTTAWIAGLQNADGSFRGDKWGESDGRYSLQALLSLAFLDALEAVDIPLALQWILTCRNPDGAFGPLPGQESHAAYSFCCVGALAVLDKVDMIDRDALGLWLAERQLPASGGFNGRPEKAPDVCYSWWIYATLVMIDRSTWIDSTSLEQFIVLCQDKDDGGIADRPGNVADLFHTFFGLSALALLKPSLGLTPVHPVYAVPFSTLQLYDISVLNMIPTVVHERALKAVA